MRGTSKRWWRVVVGEGAGRGEEEIKKEIFLKNNKIFICLRCWPVSDSMVGRAGRLDAAAER